MGAHPQPTVVVRGEVPTTMVAYGREKLAAVAAIAPGPVLDLELRLDHHVDPARERAYHVEVVLNLDGQPIRARRSAATITEAIDRAVARLRRQVEARAERPQSKVLRHRDLTSWHHEDRPAERGHFFPRPKEEREIIRRKTFALRPESIEEALFDLDALDHEFFLFVNDETGEENVVARDESGYTLLQPTPTPDAIDRVGVELRTGRPPGEMQLGEACEVLDETDQPFVFYIDSAVGRGRVVYRRYDGHYGLITPT
jgi:ribosome-associated translation inhibitor RaiA